MADVVRIVLLVLTAVALLLTFVFNGLAGAGKGPFTNTPGNLSDKYYLDFTPAGWTFSIWGFIYTYQTIFVIYSLANIFRKNGSGFLYYDPPFLPTPLYVFYIINLVLNITWLVVWDQEKLVGAAIVLDLTAWTMWICIGISMWGLNKYGHDLIKDGRRSEIKLVIGIVHNGLGMYGTWVTLATIINFCVFFSYHGTNHLRQDLSSTIGFATVALELMAYLVVDQVLFERHFRFLFTPYIVVIVALSGIVSKNMDNIESSSFILACGLLISAGLLFIFKIVRSVFKEMREPLFQTYETQPLNPKV